MYHRLKKPEAGNVSLNRATLKVKCIRGVRNPRIKMYHKFKKTEAGNASEITETQEMECILSGSKPLNGMYLIR